MAELVEAFDIAGISKSRYDITDFVEVIIHCRKIDINIRMRSLNRLDTFRHANQADQLDLSTPMLDILHSTKVLTIITQSHRLILLWVQRQILLIWQLLQQVATMMI